MLLALRLIAQATQVSPIRGFRVPEDIYELITYRVLNTDPAVPQIIRSPTSYSSVTGEKCRLPTCTQLVYYQEAEYCCDNHAR